MAAATPKQINSPKPTGIVLKSFLKTAAPDDEMGRLGALLDWDHFAARILSL